MEREPNYRKGTKVWIQIPVEGEQEKVHPAEVISILNENRLLEDKTHVLVRYLDGQGIDGYGCIPSDWIIEEPKR